ncbi:MAG TPA: hypothetical protein VK157_11570, partial [Phycisphaerales bacterium]|nr:hypothetical protein [Phycisphaerales bacterium]
MSVRTGDVMAEPSPRWTRLVIVGIVLIIAALVWITWQALRLEDRERAARQEAAFQESLRLALWRMDSALTPIIAREAARPYFEYQSFYPADRAMRSLDEPATLDDVLVPSPLLTANDPSIRVYFQVGPDGSLTSPQAPEGWTQRVAEGVYVTPYVTRNARDNIASLRDMLTQQRARLAKARQSSDLKEMQVAEELAKPAAPIAGRTSTFSDADTSGKLSDYMQRRSVASQAANVVNAPAAQQVKEASKREESREAAGVPSQYGAAENHADVAGSGAVPPAGVTKFAANESEPAPEADSLAYDAETLPAPTPIVQTDPAVQPGEFIAKWLPSSSGEPELVFTREIRVGSQRIEQGFWVNWPLLREQVMASARELVPAASLKPVLESPIALPPETLGRMLASVP